MATEQDGWRDSQNKRIRVETLLTGVILALVSVWSFSNPFMLGMFVVLASLQLIRSRALNTDDKEFEKRRFRITNPILVQGSILVVYYSIFRGLQRTHHAGTFSETILWFTLICIGISLGILLMEWFGHAEYFEWWKDRAEEKATEDDTGFWRYIACKCKAVSPIATTPAEYEIQMRQVRSKTRLVEGSYQPLPSAQNPPEPEWSWLKPILREARAWQRWLPIVVGVGFFLAQGFGWWSALLWSTGVWFASSLLADHIKYLYAFRPVRDGYYEFPSPKTMPGRILREAGSYWMSTVLVFIMMWSVF